MLAIAVFLPVRHHDFVSFDDVDFIVDNPHVQPGLSLASARWVFSPANAYTFTGGPVTWLSHMLDVTMFGMTPGPAHVVSLALHAASGALLCLLLFQLTGARWRSVVVAALFAVHPLHVESVAWIAERRPSRAPRTCSRRSGPRASRCSTRIRHPFRRPRSRWV